MIDYQIAIPSYRRPDQIKDKTLRLLEKHNIEPERIKVFVNAEEEGEYENYKQSLSQDDYSKNIEIVKGVPTIGAQRNFIEKYYEEGTYLMMFDDDLEDIEKIVYSEEKQKDILVPVENLYKEVIQRGFINCEKEDANMFGVYCARNPFFMKRKVRTTLCYVLAGVMGIIVQHDDFLNRVTNHGEDYEYSIRQYIKNGSIVRLENVTMKTKIFGKGGLESVRTFEYVYNSIQSIASFFPNHCKVRYRKNGRPELTLRDNTHKLVA